MSEFMTNDFAGWVIMSAFLFGLWRYPVPSYLTGLLVANALIVINYGSKAVLWNGIPIFPAQYPPIMSCLGLLVVYHRLGPLVAHRCWQYSILGVLFMFLFVTRFAMAPGDNGTISDHYTDIFTLQYRLWLSAFFQLIFIAGFGLVLWRTLEIDGWARYIVTWFGFLLGSLFHSVIVFYGLDFVPENDFWTHAFGSLIPAGAMAAALMIPLVWAIQKHPATLEKQQRLWKDISSHVGPNHQGVPRQRR